MATGYPTPDNAIGDIEFSCIPILVPSNSEFEGIFAAAIYGLYAEMSKEWFWREQGTMSPSDAAFLAARGLAITDAYAECGGDMSCEDFADCIEENETVQAALVTNLTTVNMTNQLTTIINQNGFGNPNSINTSQTTVVDRNPSGSLQEDIKELENCNLNQLWGGIREGIVARLNDVTKDLLEDLSVIPSAAERLTIFIDAVPVIGDLAEGVALQITNFIPDILLLYESYESAETLDELACEIFSLVCAECRYPTMEELVEIYANHTLMGLAFNDLTLDGVATAILDLLTQTNEVAFFTMSVQSLLILNLQAAFNGANGSRSIVKWAELGEDSASDNWLELCETCNDSYFLWTWDFVAQGQGDFYPDPANTTSKAIFEPGKGWRAVPHSTSKRFNVNMPFDATWEVRAAAMSYTGTGATDRTWYRRPTWGSTTGQQNASAGFASGEWEGAWEGYASVTGYKEVGFYATCPTADDIWLNKASILFNVGKSPAGNGVPTNDLTPYSTP